ncbi:MAG TPA: fructosamine kinase family protein [Woeseiaceae bacterium]|nr:fructosamine kinase family protein [Woeseiaceae bacterium]
MRDWPRLAAALEQAGLRCDPAGQPRALGGGSHATWQVQSDAGRVFLKSAPAAALAMFAAERDALLELGAAGAVRVPAPLACLAAGGSSVLALQWLELSPPGEAANRSFGRRLAALHRHTAPAFGWHRDNTIGATPQPNTPSDDWVHFFRRHRLRHQLELAEQNGHGAALARDGDWLGDNLPRLFDGHRPQPSMLHGDLWGGNWAVHDGEPVMFDPAFHYGDRECDLAMTRLFGGFSSAFYRAYEDAWPLAPGAHARVPLYQLYHVLNHLNLFGGGYLGQARCLLARIRTSLGG